MRKLFCTLVLLSGLVGMNSYANPTSVELSDDASYIACDALKNSAIQPNKNGEIIGKAACKFEQTPNGDARVLCDIGKSGEITTPETVALLLDLNGRGSNDYYLRALGAYLVCKPTVEPKTGVESCRCHANAIFQLPTRQASGCPGPVCGSYCCLR